jgi:hypothetical protein
MNLELSAMYLIEEFHRSLEADRRREMREALRRGAVFEARAAAESAATESGGISRVASGDGARGRGDPCPDLGRGENLNPAPGA